MERKERDRCPGPTTLLRSRSTHAALLPSGSFQGYTTGKAALSFTSHPARCSCPQSSCSASQLQAWVSFPTLPTTPGHRAAPPSQGLPHTPKGKLLCTNVSFWITCVKNTVNVKENCPCFGKDNFLDVLNNFTAESKVYHRHNRGF